ncbi:hypothetical protein VHUM_01971 [Vanrija humicola]|uniref:Xylanolytic transcriptional activator regulatory domain-containing protein n=1 Tax=Vanrija humicola TaxID=5417 RepID=A0A7D8Z560_VANHU|nr:hypothetical protein VHUM_01971 [Vanrija humicola]
MTSRNEAEGQVVSELRERLAAIEGLLSTTLSGSARRRDSRSSSRGRERSRDRSRDHRDRDRDRDHHRRGSDRDRDHYRDHRDHRDRDHRDHRDRDHRDERYDYHRRSRSPSPRHHSHHGASWAVPPAPVPPPPPPPPQPQPQQRPEASPSSSFRSRYDPSPGDSREFVFQYDTPQGTTPHDHRPGPSYRPKEDNDESYGTLVIDPSGRSKWLGPTAGTEWLKNVSAMPRRSRSPSHGPTSPVQDTTYGFGQESQFPFASWGPPPTMETIMFHLPAPDEAAVLVDSYYRNYTWNHDVAPRRSVQPIFDRVYVQNAPEPLHRRVHPQQLALLFIIMAMGALHNPDLPPHDPSAEHHLTAARWCLVKGDFIGNNTIAGLQALIIMAHYHLETEKGRNGDAAWPLWGLAMRLVTAMGLHRDGERWNLPTEVVEERRHVFWECHTIDVFQANCFSRPSSLRPEHIDTEFPSQSWTDGPSGLKSFRTLNRSVLDQAMDVRPTPYSSITALYDRLCAFERQIPFHLRCRTALLALPSVYADAESATRDSPEVSQRNLHRTFQQFTLALNVSESILFLQRPYFVKALQEAPQDPTRSIYGKSYLAVVERCNVLIEVVAGLYELYPTVTARHWFFWYHLFTAAVCIGTMIIKNSTNPLAGFAIGQVDHSIKLYSSVLRDHATPSLVQNHQWLLRLRQRALAKLEHAPPGAADDDVDVELLGWRTRLIERARGGHRATNVPISSTPHSNVPSTTGPATAPGSAPATGEPFTHTSPPVPPPSFMPAPTLDQTPLTTQLHQFWDPTLLLESREGPNGQQSLTVSGDHVSTPSSQAGRTPHYQPTSLASPISPPAPDAADTHTDCKLVELGHGARPPAARARYLWAHATVAY